MTGAEAVLHISYFTVELLICLIVRLHACLWHIHDGSRGCFLKLCTLHFETQQNTAVCMPLYDLVTRTPFTDNLQSLADPRSLPGLFPLAVSRTTVGLLYERRSAARAFQALRLPPNCLPRLT